MTHNALHGTAEVARHLIHLQLEIERIGVDPSGRLFRLPGPDPDDIACVAAYRYPGGYAVYTSSQIPPSTHQEIRALEAERVFHDSEAVRALLAPDVPCVRVSAFHTYTFPRELSPGQFPDAIRLDESHRTLIEAYHPGMDITHRPAYAVIEGGRIVGTCTSAREDFRAGEADVFTVPEFRRRGYGRQVAAAWGHHLLRQGKIAFYSHTDRNLASRALAQSLGLRLVFSLVAFS